MESIAKGYQIGSVCSLLRCPHYRLKMTKSRQQNGSRTRSKSEHNGRPWYRRFAFDEETSLLEHPEAGSRDQLDNISEVRGIRMEPDIHLNEQTESHRKRSNPFLPSTLQLESQAPQRMEPRCNGNLSNDETALLSSRSSSSMRLSQSTARPDATVEQSECQSGGSSHNGKLEAEDSGNRKATIQVLLAVIVPLLLAIIVGISVYFIIMALHG